MREVDEALARVFPLRTDKDRGAGVPPPPHVNARRETASGGPRDASAPSGVSAEQTPPVAWPALVGLLTVSYSDRFEGLADSLVNARERSGAKVVWFTSCQRAEGSTTLLMTFSRILAARPLRVVLVDADLSAPKIGRQLALRDTVGLDGVVSHGHDLDEALVESPTDGLTFLPMKSAAAQPRAFLASPGWAGTVARLRRAFDLVLIDGGPLFQGYGSSRIPVAADAAVLVRNRVLTSERALERARVLLQRGGVPVLGLAETFVE